MANTENFDVVVSTQLDENTEVVTVVPKSDADVAAWEDKVLYSAIQSYDKDKIIYSPFTLDAVTSEAVTLDLINELADNLNNNLRGILRVNAIIRRCVLTDELIGRMYEAIYANINSEYKLSYPNPEGRNKQKTLNNVKNIINDFNDQIDLKNLIRESIAGTFLEGNRILSLRKDEGNYVVDYLPLGIAGVSDYYENGCPSLYIDLKELERRLKKTYQKNKKRKALWLEDVKADIRYNYAPTVYTDYMAGDSYSRLDTKYNKIIRINNLGRKYGVSPIFRALKSSVVLDELMKTDVAVAKSKQRKILLQILRREVITDLHKKGFAEAIHAHGQLMQALQTTSCAYTAAPFVEKVEYVSPPKDDTNTDKTNQYQRNILNALGVEFIDTQAGTVSVANISLNQLMRLINAIGEQLERVLECFYKVILEDSGIDMSYAPSIRIIDSEQLDAALRKELATFLFTTLGASYETAYKILGFDVEDEYSKRKKENDDDITDTFYPRPTAYTTSGDSEAGRPANEGEGTDTEKQARDDIVNNG